MLLDPERWQEGMTEQDRFLSGKSSSDVQSRHRHGGISTRQLGGW